MSEERKFPELSDLDWDSAIEEWERSTFVPAVARDLDTSRTGAPLGPGPAQEPQDVSALEELPTLMRSDPPPARSRGGLGYLFRSVPDAPATSRAVEVHVPLDDEDPATVMRRGKPPLGRGILRPEARAHDPDQETVVGRRSSLDLQKATGDSPPSSTMTRAASPLDVLESISVEIAAPAPSDSAMPISVQVPLADAAVDVDEPATPKGRQGDRGPNVAPSGVIGGGDGNSANRANSVDASRSHSRLRRCGRRGDWRRH